MPITRLGTYSQIKGTSFKLPCRVATTANITLSGTQTIDGVAVVAGERVLVKNQSTSANNGVYIVAAGAWSRAVDFSLDDDVFQGLEVYVSSGTANGGYTFVLTTANPITLGTTGLTFGGTYLPLAGGTLTGALTGTSATFSGNVGVGVTPSAWQSTWKVNQVLNAGFVGNNSQAYMTYNAYYDSGWKYITNGVATSYLQDNDGAHWWYKASNNTSGAGAAITFTPVLTLSSTGAATFSSSIAATSATFSSDVTYNAASSNSNIVLKRSTTYDASIYFLNSTTYQWQINTDASNNLNFYKFQGGTGNALTIASTGAATFSSKVTTTGIDNDWGLVVNGSTTVGKSYGANIKGGSNSSDVAFLVSNYVGGDLLRIRGDGVATFSSSVTATSGIFNTTSSIADGQVTIAQASGNTGLVINSAIAQSPKLYLRDAGGAGYSEIQANNKLYLNASSVGIGTTSPSSLASTTNLVVRGTSGGTTALVQSLSSDAGCSVALYSGASSSDDPAILFQKNLRFGSVTDVGLSNFAERMRITSGGDVGIGVTPGSGVRLQVSGGQIRCVDTYNNTTATAANLVVSSGGTFERSTSSLRFKTDIEDLTLEKAELIYKMRPIWYRSKCENDRKDWSWYGFIAEELAELEPRLVQWGINEDGENIPDGVQYERLTVLLVKAIQEQKAQIEELKLKLN